VKNQSNKLTGRVLWYDQRDGFGVLEDAKGNELYFDASVINKAQVASIKHGISVVFKLNAEIKHVACACEVEVAQ
jgi:cold shock CspA family protein